MSNRVIPQKALQFETPVVSTDGESKTPRIKKGVFVQLVDGDGTYTYSDFFSDL
jgi:hypothetical protein